MSQDSSLDRELDRLDGVLSAALTDLEKITSRGLSKKLTPALMERLTKSRFKLSSSIGFLRLALAGTSLSDITLPSDERSQLSGTKRQAESE